MAKTKLTYNVDGKTIDTVDIVLTGRQIRQAAGLSPASDHILIKIGDGISQSIGLDEQIDLLSEQNQCFLSFQNDRTYSFTLNERGFEWGADKISAADLRKYADIPEEHELFMDSKKDKPIGDEDMVHLNRKGVERIRSRPRSWKLKVQDVVLTISTPTVVVREVLIEAGIDPDAGWTAAIKYVNAPREAVELDGIVDLTRKGIEKLWLRPANIQNGEQTPTLQRAFNLQDQDEIYLSQSALRLETIVEGGRRWAIIRGFSLPPGYREEMVDIAVEIPPTYPMAQLDMFYCYPALELETGVSIPQTQVRQNIEGRSYQRWSRHRQGTTSWNPAKDSIITHIAIILESITREVE